MKTLLEREKRSILAMFVADQIAEEALNEDFTTIDELLFYYNENRVNELLSTELYSDYLESIKDAGILKNDYCEKR